MYTHTFNIKMNNPYKKNSSNHANRVPQFASGSQLISATKMKNEPTPGAGGGRPVANQLADPSFNMRQQQSQQQNVVTTEGQPDVQLRHFNTFMNAPTSLANLAQLGGISLLPVGVQHQQQQQQQRHQSLHNMLNNTQVISFDNLQRPKITVSTSGGQHQQQFRQNGLILPNAVPANAARVYNRETKPSIQLLNRVTSDYHDPLAINSATGAGAPRHRQSNLDFQSSIQPNTANKKPRSQAKLTAANQRFPNNNQVQVLPVSESIGLNFIPNSIKELQSIEGLDPLVQPPGFTSPSSANQSNDNLSLMKLMAILNNPALTITPVGASTSQTNNLLDHEVIWGNICQTIPPGNLIDERPRQQNHSNSLNSSTPTSTYDLQSNFGNHVRSDQSKSKKAKNNNKIPKSAANLQLVYGGSVQPAVEPSHGVPTYIAQHYVPINDKSSLPEPKLTNINQKQYSGLNWLSSLAASRIEDKPSSVTLSWSSNTCSEKNPKFVSEDSTLNNSIESSRNPTYIQNNSQQELAVVAAVDDTTSINLDTNESIFEPDCIVSSPKISLHQLNRSARYQDIKYTVFSKAPRGKTTKEPIQSSKRRLYVPRIDRKSFKKARSTPETHAIEININEQDEEAIVSERHFVLEKVTEIAEDVGRRRHIPIDPDDIFVNKSKRIMSKIDVDMERRKRRRFEKISGRKSPNNPECNDCSDNSDDESFAEDNVSSVESTAVLIQLPLEEAITDQKRNYFSLIGLLSRDDKNKILLKQCEDRLKNVCPAALQESGEIPEEIERFVDTIIQTGGTDIKLRTETDIKRNDLPFIEGLNRNTSRIKMSFMSALGLEKRSKRTTLYKVKPQENVSTQMDKPQNELINKVKNLANGNVKARIAPEPTNTVEPVKHNGATTNVQYQIGNADFLRKAIKLAQASCREAIKAPNKDEYMRSLGLMAS